MLYRGFDVDRIPDSFLTDGEIQGSECTMFTGSAPGSGGFSPERGDTVTDIPWRDMQSESVWVTGGVTDDIRQTRRFRGTEGTVAVIDNDGTEPQFEQVQYDPGYMDGNPGVLCHVLKAANAEIRPNGELMGIANRRPSGNYIIEHWGDLPATSSRSMFADEREWIARSESVDADVQGVVAITNEWSVYISQRDSADIEQGSFDVEQGIQDYYAGLNSKMDAYDGPLYMVVYSGKGGVGGSDIDLERVWRVYDGEKFIPPGDAPSWIAGSTL
jgi:hypothetical protein